MGFHIAYNVIATEWAAQNTLNFSFNYLYFKNGLAEPILWSKFDEQDKVHIFAKFKKVLYMDTHALSIMQSFLRELGYLGRKAPWFDCAGLMGVCACYISPVVSDNC